MDFHGGAYEAAVGLTLAAGLAIIALTHGGLKSPIGVAMSLYQQALLLMSGWSAWSCIVSSSYADMVIRPWRFILADQALMVIFALFHGIAVFESFIFRPRKKVQVA